eukprot:4765673-Pyramimonas_sp.AAC.1
MVPRTCGGHIRCSSACAMISKKLYLAWSGSLSMSKGPIASIPRAFLTPMRWVAALRSWIVSCGRSSWAAERRQRRRAPASA